ADFAYNARRRNLERFWYFRSPFPIEIRAVRPRGSENARTHVMCCLYGSRLQATTETPLIEDESFVSGHASNIRKAERWGYLRTKVTQRSSSIMLLGGHENEKVSQTRYWLNPPSITSIYDVRSS